MRSSKSIAQYRHGSALKIVIIAVAVLFCLALAASINSFIGGRSRSLVSRIRSDLRTQATALEAYYVDHNTYPAWSAQPGENMFSIQEPKDHALYDKLPTFMARVPGRLADTLTTPFAYLSTYFDDPYGRARGQSLCYWTNNGHGWIIWSAGPDGEYDLTMDNVAQAYNPAKENPNEYLIDRTYDPTNGTTSRGDVYRVKQ